MSKTTPPPLSATSSASPPIFRAINGVPVLVRAARALASCEAIEDLLVVAPAEHLELARTALAQHGLPDVRVLGVRAGRFGAALAEPGDDAESVVARADRLMYVSKFSGKNRVTLGNTEQ